MNFQEASVRKALQTVIDPELKISIVDLGLVQEIVVDRDRLYIRYTLTTPGCPLAPVIEERIRETIKELGIDETHLELELSFDPPWHQGMMTEEARLELGL